MKNKILSLLVLLLTAATGAWAQTQITQGFEDGLGDWTKANCNSNSGITGINSGYSPTHGGTNMFRFYYSASAPQYLISPEIDAADGGTMSFYYARYSNSYPETFKVGYSTTTNDPTAFTWGNEVTCTNIYTSEYLEYTYDIPAGAKYVAIAHTSNDQFYLFIDDITIDIESNAVDVTTNAEEGETFFTEATFLMPTYDATAEYVIVRNMGSEDVTVLVGDGTVEQPRFRVRKKEQGEGYEAVDYTSLEQIAALISVYDAVEEKTLTPQQDFYVKIFKIDEQTGQPLSADGVELADFDFAPGLYAVKAIAQDDSEDYGGETGFSNLFQLVEKVDLTFDPAPVVNMTVTTKEGEADPVEATAEQLEAGKIEQLEPGTEVKLKAKKGYKFIKVTAKEEK